MAIFRKGLGPHALAIGVSGIKMGERLLEIGAGTPGMFAALAAKVGLTGRACAIARSEQEKRALEEAAASGGVLVEVELAPGAFPSPDESFDLIVVDATGGTARELEPDVLAESYRVVRHGGRLLTVTRLRGALARTFARPPAAEHAPSIEDALRAAGFRPVRILAEREGLRFIEGMRTG